MSKKKPEHIVGELEAFFETGTEGVCWSFYEDGKTGYEGLHYLQNGDLLTVFNDAARKQVLWQGKVKLEYKTRWQSYGNPTYPKAGQQEVLGMWVHGLQVGLDPEVWANMFFDAKPATLVPKKPRPSAAKL